MATLDPNNNRTISQLQQAATLTGTEVMAVVQGGITVRTTAQAIANLGGGGTSTTINGLSGAIGLLAGSNISLSQSGQNITINSTASGSVTGTGAANQVAWWNGTSSITGDSNFVHDPTPGTGFTIMSQDFGGSPDWTGAIQLQSQIFGAGTGASLIQATNNADGSNATFGAGQGGTSGIPYLFGVISVNNAAGAQQQLFVDYSSSQVGNISISHDKDDGSITNQSQITISDMGIAGEYNFVGGIFTGVNIGDTHAPDGNILPGGYFEYVNNQLWSLSGSGDSTPYTGQSNSSFLISTNETVTTYDKVYTAPGSVNISHDKSDGTLFGQSQIQLTDSEMLLLQLGAAGAQSIIQLYGSSTEIGYNNGSTSANITFNSNSITINPQVGGTTYMSLTNSFINIFGDLQLASYPDTRNDGPATNFLYTDGAGDLKSAPISSLALTPNVITTLYSAGVTLTSSDIYTTVAFTGGSGAPAVTLTAVPIGAITIICDVSFNSGANPITLEGGAGSIFTDQTGDSATTYTISKNGVSVTVQRITTTNWMVIAVN